jgi:nucleoside-triphosphatase THEP1
LELIGVESILEALKNKARELIVIDEIGKMELFSSRFQDAVIKALDSSIKVLGTIQLKSDPFVERIKARKDVEIVSVNTNNLDYLPDRILTAILKRS